MTKVTRIMIYVFAIAVLSASCQASEHIASPNVILVLTDDLGYSDIGCYDATKVKTPNIERLSTEQFRALDLQRLLSLSPLRCLHLINIGPHRMTFHTVENI